MKAELASLNQTVSDASAFVDDVLTQVGKVIVGQKTMLERIVIGFLSNGHILLEGVPGLAKTTAVKSVASAVRAQFRRIQFTPDLLPADLIGTLVYDNRTGSFKTRRGPIFTNILLADEINRAPAKVQSALLEAMQERQVTIGDETHKLDDPFLVLATQNPIEQEGTYPLPEAQTDRFLLKLKVGYPSKKEEGQIMDRAGAFESAQVGAVVDSARILEARQVVSQVYMDEKVKNYILDIVFALRDPGSYGLKDLVPLIAYGPSPRASIALAGAARAQAFLRHRGYVTPDDVKLLGPDVLRHRVLMTYEAEAEEKSSDDLIKRVFDTIEVP